MEESKTLQEWCGMFDIVIMDADGFAYDPLLLEKKFTLQEFNKGIIRCTCTWNSDSWKRLDMLVKEVYGNDAHL